jgi:hypothetical protein
MKPHLVLQASGATRQLKNGKLKIVFAVYATHEDGTPAAHLKKNNFVILRMVNASSLPVSVSGMSFSVWVVQGLYRIEIGIKKWEKELSAIRAVKGDREGVTTIFVNPA